ncbi:MAG: hypothetical protein AB8G16_18460 [Gammaproteobacteria bacterium]
MMITRSFLLILMLSLFTLSSGAQTTIATSTPTAADQVVLPYPPPRFRTWKTNPNYHRPDFPIVFVSSYRDQATTGRMGELVGKVNGGNFGSDVLQVGAPEAGQELWILLTNGQAKKLFPIEGVHDGMVDGTLTPVSGYYDDHIIGSVIEPSISIDGSRVYFTYFHDAYDLGFCCSKVTHSNFEGWAKGGDLYSIDLTPLLADVNTSPSTLTARRLTKTLPQDKLEFATNPIQATNTASFPAGIVYTGAIEIDGPYGRQLLFSSTRALTGNSNNRMTRKNKNFNLFTADIDFGAPEPLSNIKQAQYYTTTSAISPNRLRTGYAFSYQANTEDARQWHIQQVIGHKWTPLLGYGFGNELAHLASFCVKTTSSPELPAGDYTVATQYYNQNNNGFGALIAQPMNKVGLNTYDNPITNGYVPGQVGAVKITQNVITHDDDSDNGKFTTPACGEPDSLYAAYDPVKASHHYSHHRYRPYVVHTDLEAADPAASPGAYQKVIKSFGPGYAAIWPKPVIDWSQRLTGVAHPTGDAQQDVPPSPIDSGFAHPPGAPYAVIGTSSLYNTDVTPVDCRASIGYFDPFVVGDAKVDPLYNNIAGLSRLMQNGPGDISLQTGSCAPPDMSDVFGVAIYLTSNRLREDQFDYRKQGYRTDFAGSKESKRLLGIFKLGMEGQSDASFKALVPANVPLDFHLLDSTGVKLADVRSWHSLKPREERVDCGGCHNHREGEAIDWYSSDSSSPAVATTDMALSTATIQYDANCQADVVQQTGVAVTDVPVWQDLSAEFHTQCGSCHAQGSNDVNAKNAFDYDPSKLNAFLTGGLPADEGKPAPGNPLVPLFARKYINRYNANASPMFWAAFGGRTDGRDNSKAQYQPDAPDFSTCSNGDPSKCGFVYTSAHDNLATCNGNSAVAANWVYKLSQWIDNHAPVDITGKPYGYHEDRFPPTVESAFVPNGTDCAVTPASLDIGFWDDSGAIVALDVDINDDTYFDVVDPALLQNGQIYSRNLSGANITGIYDSRLRVTVTDAAGNRQSYEKTVDELVKECQASL